jgi:hypothetical protein
LLHVLVFSNPFSLSLFRVMILWHTERRGGYDALNSFDCSGPHDYTLVAPSFEVNFAETAWIYIRTKREREADQ